VRRALRPGGTYVTLGGEAMPLVGALILGPLASLGSAKSSGLLLWWKPFEPADVATLTDLVATGAVTPSIDRRFPLSETVAALRWMDDGHARGKVVIDV